MKPSLSKVTTSTAPKAKFKSFQVHEVATSLSESKYIASDLADARRYAYRATAVLVGNVNVKTYEPIYIDGLPNGLTTYWTVLKVTHLFGGTVGNYMLEVELGADVLNDTNEYASKAKDTRDVNAEISGQNIDSPSSTLVSYSTSVNASALEKVENLSVRVSAKNNFVADAGIPDLYQTNVPDFSKVKQTAIWRATKRNQVL